MKYFFLLFVLIFYMGIFGVNSQINSYTTINSDLINDTVNVIYHDSTGGIWFGTQRGLCRLQNEVWTDYSDSLLDVNVRDLEHETTSHSKEIWVATGNGLSVLAYNIDGVTSATTYTTETDFGNGTIIDNDVRSVAVDPLHNRWAGTPSGISVFRGSTWDTLLTYLNSNNELMSFNSNMTTMIDASEIDSVAFIVSNGGGIVRQKYDVDGFSGASTWNAIRWSNFPSDNIYSVDVSGYNQVYGSDFGGYYHGSLDAKEDWTVYTTGNSAILSDHVNSVHIDNQHNLWFGTDEGLSILTSGGWYNYTTSSGLINPLINYITGDLNGDVWIGTNGGVEWFDGIPGNLVDIKEAEKLTDNIFITPNPAASDIYLLINNVDNTIKINLYNLNGQLIAEFYPELSNTREQMIHIPLDKYNLKAGTYVISIYNNNRISSYKIIIQ